MPIDAISTSAAAKLLGVAPSTVTRACVKHGIGTLVSPRMRVLTPEDVEALKGLVSSQRGNPNFGSSDLARKAGNARWKAAAAKAKKAAPKKKHGR